MRQISKGKDPAVPCVSMTDAGISITTLSANGESKIEAIDWAKIEKVIAYKRDCYGFDLICIAIGGAGSAFEISEGMKGWDELLECAPDYLPGWQRKSDWYEAVMLPAFQLNRTIIFSRT
jgi:hypothetical protein